MSGGKYPEDRRGLWGLLFSRGFGVFFAARLATAISTWLFTFVVAVAAFDASGSAFFVGVVTALQFIPQVMLGTVAGSWADRGDIRFQMVLGRALLTVASLALSVWYFFFDTADSGPTSMALLFTSLIFGVGLVLGGPAMQSAAPLLVSRQELPAAMALNTAPMTIGRIAGPTLGGVATSSFGYGPALLTGGLLNVVFIALIATITFPPARRLSTDDTYPMREALAFAVRNRSVLLSLVGVTAVGLAAEPFITLAPAIAHTFSGDPQVTGSLLTATGVGAAVGLVVSSALASRARQDLLALLSLLGMLMMAAGLLACVAPLPKTGLLLAFAASGFGFIVAHTGLSTIMQLRLPAVLRGRVMALWLIGFVGSRPLGSIIAGAIADTWSVQIGFAVFGLLMIGAAIACRPSMIRD